MKPFNLSQYMYSLSQAAGAGLVGYSSGSSYAAGTVGAALQALGPAAGYTPGSVPFAGASGALTQDNANFFWDTANARLSIGPSIASYKLTVAAGATGVPAVFQSNAASNTVGLRNLYSSASQQAGSAIQYQNENGIGVGSLSMNVNTDGSSTFFLSASPAGSRTTNNAQIYMTLLGLNGRVGFGTQNPQMQVHVNGGGDTYQRFTNGTSTAGVDIGIGANNRAYLYNRNASDLVLGTSNSDRLVIAAAGQVRIGTNTEPYSASAVLQTDGDHSIFGTQPGLMFNTYYSGGWYAQATGYTGAIKVDTVNGGLQFLTSSASIAGGASFTMPLSGQFDPGSSLHIYGSTYWVNSDKALWQHDGTNVYFRAQNIANLYFGTNGQTVLSMYTNVLYPVSDNGANLGQGSQRWGTVYAVNGAIQTSDAREKQWRGPLNKDEMAAAKDIIREIGVYQWLHEIADVGENADLHIGVTAQKVEQIMVSHGLDPYHYGFFVYDQWDEHQQPTGDGDVMETVPAGDRFSVRYDELAMFLLAAQNRGQEELEARIAALEAKP